jgi:hypothetical protein
MVAVIEGPLPKEAAAAGAEAFSISGPGLEKPIEVSLYGLDTPELQDLPEQMGAWFLTGGEVVKPLMPAPPTRALGPRYIVTWYLLGPPEVPRNKRAVRQELYPDAEGGPLVHAPAGQGIWSGAVGWYRPPKRLSRALAILGVRPLKKRSGSRFGAVALAVAATLIAAGLFLVSRTRRRRDRFEWPSTKADRNLSARGPGRLRFSLSWGPV